MTRIGGLLPLLLGVTLAVPVAGSERRNDVPPVSGTVFETVMREALSPAPNAVRYDYIMTGRIRLLIPWLSADDVGGGYVRRGTSLTDPKARFIEVLFGSDPAKAPRAINHWGAAIERFTATSNAVLGFMTSVDTASAKGAEADLSRRKESGRYPFQAVVSSVDETHAVSRSLPIFSSVNFNLHQLDAARDLAIGRLREDRPMRDLGEADRRCPQTRGFLQAVEELAERALSVKTAPQSVCYTYQSRNYTLTLTEQSLVPSKAIDVKRKDGTKLERVYRDALHASFLVVNLHTKERTTFELLLGTRSDLRGVPLQIVHKPNWWFQVVLNLETVS